MIKEQIQLEYDELISPRVIEMIHAFFEFAQVNDVIITRQIERVDLMELLEGDYKEAAEELIEHMDICNLSEPLKVSFIIRGCPIEVKGKYQVRK